MTNILPEGLVNYSQTPVFTAQNVPEKLTSVHNTKAGLWGKLVVITGGVDYFIPSQSESPAHLQKGDIGIIEPGVDHYVRLSDDASFKVEFYKRQS